MKRHLVTALLAGALLSACAPQVPPVIMSKKSPVELRAMQARVFETGDRTRTVRAVISTLQDLGYNIDKVDAGSGTVSATKLAALRMSAAVSSRGAQTAVRANAVIDVQNQRNQVDSPVFYQTLFFEPLAQAMFLQAQADSAPASAEMPAPMPPALAAPSDKPAPATRPTTR